MKNYIYCFSFVINIIKYFNNVIKSECYEFDIHLFLTFVLITGYIDKEDLFNFCTKICSL